MREHTCIRECIRLDYRIYYELTHARVKGNT